MKIEIMAKRMQLRGDRPVKRGDVLEAPKDGTEEEFQA